MEGWDGTTTRRHHRGRAPALAALRRERREAHFRRRSHGRPPRRPGEPQPAHHHRGEQGGPGAAARDACRRAQGALWQRRRPGHRLPTHPLRPVLQAQRQGPLRAARRLSAPDPGPQIRRDQRRPGLDRRASSSGSSRTTSAAAKIAWDVGADFVDIKHCHGYLLHEFLERASRGPASTAARSRTARRLLREIIAGIRASGNRIELGVRLERL